MDQQRRLIRHCACILLAVCGVFGRHVAAQSTNLATVHPDCFVVAMLGERFDLRFGLYGSLTNLETAQMRGLVLFVPGRLEKAELVATNECPTVESVLKRYGRSGYSSRRQLRVIQKHMILQSDGQELTKKILPLSLNAADVVILAPRE